MKKWIQHSLFLLSVCILTGWQTPASQLRKMPNSTWDKGEELVYRVHYGWITAGRASLKISNNTVDVNGRECYHVVGEGVSAKSFDWFFKVRDKYETFIDTESMVPWKFKRKIHEGKFKNYSETHFDQLNQTATVYIRDLDPQIYDVPANIQDVVSLLYFARAQDYGSLKEGDRLEFQDFLDRKVHNLQVEYQGKEVIKVAGQKYNAIKLQPLVEEDGTFEHEGDLFIWISDDDNRIPIRVESGLVVGSIMADLIGVSGLKHPFDAKIQEEQ